jgi:hypothetical protein
VLRHWYQDQKEGSKPLVVAYCPHMTGFRHFGNALAIIGALIFIGVLFISAYWERDIRWLHFLQSWMYLVAIALMLRGNKWGYFIGTGAAFFWDYANVFVTTFLRNGLAQTQLLIYTGHMTRPDQFISVPGWVGNLIVIVGSAAAYIAMPKKQSSDLVRFLGATLATTLFFALSMYISQPRYLALFPALLHPHLRI